MNDKQTESDKANEQNKKDTAPGRFVNPIARGKFRNMICICGSGKKVKKCHGIEHSIDVVELNQINRMIDSNNKKHQDEMKRQIEKNKNEAP